MQNIFPKHWNDQRTSKEIFLTNRFIEIISDNNIKQLNFNKYPCIHKNILTLGIGGMPYNAQEFQGLQFPGKFIRYFSPGTEPKGTEEFYLERLQKTKRSDIIDEMDKIVEEYGGKVILIYHSFGSYVGTLYAHYHPEKVIGIIQLGCTGITFSAGQKQYYQEISRIDLSNIDPQEYWKKYVQSYEKTQPLRMIQNKFNYLAFKRLYKEILGEVLQWRRQLPPVLKLLAFGRNDQIMAPMYFNHTAMHNIYQNKLDLNYEARLIKTYKIITGDTSINSPLQEKFIFSFPKIGHTLHLRKKKQIQQAMNLYFSVLLQNQIESAKM